MANNLPILVTKCAVTNTTTGKPVDTNILVIDPNKLNDNGTAVDRYVSPEDLIMFVEVRAFMNTKLNVVRNEGEAPETYVISKNKWYSSSNPKLDDTTKKDAFTTDWTEMFDAKKPYDTEGFGIQNIDIEFNASLVPKIHIEFVDVRGKNLLEKGDSPENPYNVFYTFPYPLFQLTVKGFFGKAISLPLVMEKAITRLDPSTGNYIISADFKSWTFAILNDLPLLYALIVPFMFPKQSGNGNAITAEYEGQQIIDEIFATYHAQNPKAINDQIAISKLFLLAREIPKDVSKDSVIREMKDKSDAVNQILNSLEVFKKTVAAIVADTASTDPQKWTALKTEFTVVNASFQEQLGKINEGSATPLNIDYTKIFTETYFQDPTDTAKVNDTKFINEGYLSIKQVLTTYNAALIENAIVAYSNIFRNALQFVPNIENVVKVVMFHIEAFIQLLIRKTEEIYQKVLAKNSVITDAQRAKRYEIYQIGGNAYRRLPWPEYYYDARKGYGEPIKNFPGNDLGNPDVKDWGEVLFINEMYRAFERAKTFIEQEGVTGGQGVNEVFVWTPFSIPVGKNLVPAGKDHITRVREALERMLCGVFHNGIVYKALDPAKRADMMNEWVKNDLEDTINSLINSTDQGAFNAFKSLWSTDWEVLMNRMKSPSPVGFPNEYQILENIGHATYSSTPFAPVGYVASHDYKVRSSAVPALPVMSAYNNIVNTQAKTIGVNPLPVDPTKLMTLNIYDVNTPTMLGDIPVSPLSFTNNYTLDDIFLCRT